MCADGNTYTHVVFEEPVVKHWPTHSQSSFKSNVTGSGGTGLQGLELHSIRDTKELSPASLEEELAARETCRDYPNVGMT